MAKYVYDGAISQHTAASVRQMMRKYSHPIELKAFPGERMPKLPEHSITHEGCMGETYTNTSEQWGLVHKDYNDAKAGCFLFMLTAAEKKMVVDAVPDLIQNAEPFKTVIDNDD